MSSRVFVILIWMLGGGATPWAGATSNGAEESSASDAPPVRHISSRDVVLSFALKDGARADFVNLWLSRDEGKSWVPTDVESDRWDKAVYRAPGDGRYDFFLIAHNTAGTSSAPPVAGARPQVSVIIDTTPPTLQIHQAEIRSLADLDRKLVVHLTAFDENLGDAGVRLFFRSQMDSPWRDGGAVAVQDGVIGWSVEDGLPTQLDVRIVATDLAGNWSKDDRLGVETTLIVAADSSAAKATTRPAVAAAVESEDDLANFVVERVSPVEVERGNIDDQPARSVKKDSAASRKSAATTPAIARLMRLAKRHMAGGQFALAEGRLRDALKIAPDSPDLLVRHGSALYRLKRYDDAASEFSSALSADGDNIAALEGNALVDATLRRYPEARKQLRRLLELQPESAKTWVKFGDVEHSLGNSHEAIAAWEKALGMQGVSAEVVRRATERLKLFRRTVGESPGGK